MNPPDRVITKRILLVLCDGVGVSGSRRTPTTSIEIATDRWITSCEVEPHLPEPMALYDAVVVMGSEWEKAQPTKSYLLRLGYPAQIASTNGELRATFWQVERIASEEADKRRSAPGSRAIWASAQAFA